jgi:hypothetical protein
MHNSTILEHQGLAGKTLLVRERKICQEGI